MAAIDLDVVLLFGSLKRIGGEVEQHLQQVHPVDRRDEAFVGHMHQQAVLLCRRMHPHEITQIKQHVPEIRRRHHAGCPAHETEVALDDVRAELQLVTGIAKLLFHVGHIERLATRQQAHVQPEQFQQPQRRGERAVQVMDDRRVNLGLGALDLLLDLPPLHLQFQRAQTGHPVVALQGGTHHPAAFLNLKGLGEIRERTQLNGLPGGLQ